MTALPPAPTYRPPAQARPSKFGALAWTALILGIIGVVGSPVIILNNLTAVVAAVGFILGVIALFGTKKTLALVGVLLCVGGIVFTVLAQGAAVKEFDELGEKLGVSSGDASTPAQMLTVGETYRGTNIDITVANPTAITTSATASPERKAKAISYDITLANHGTTPWSGVTMLIRATAGSTNAEQVFDSAAGLDGTPSQDVLPGKSLAFTIAFLDAAPGDISLQLGSMGDEKVYFTHKR